MHSMRKQKVQISCVVTAQLIRSFVFATLIVQSLFFLNLKFQASSYCTISVAAQAVLCQTWSELPKTGSLASRLIWCNLYFSYH